VSSIALAVLSRNRVPLVRAVRKEVDAGAQTVSSATLSQHAVW
jgi:hypothetical protein